MPNDIDEESSPAVENSLNQLSSFPRKPPLRLSLQPILEDADRLHYFWTKNSDIAGAVAAPAGGFGKPSASITVRSMLSC